MNIDREKRLWVYEEKILYIGCCLRQLGVSRLSRDIILRYVYQNIIDGIKLIQQHWRDQELIIRKFDMNEEFSGKDNILIIGSVCSGKSTLGIDMISLLNCKLGKTHKAFIMDPCKNVVNVEWPVDENCVFAEDDPDILDQIKRTRRNQSTTVCFDNSRLINKNERSYKELILNGGYNAHGSISILQDLRNLDQVIKQNMDYIFIAPYSGLETDRILRDLGVFRPKKVKKCYRFVQEARMFFVIKRKRNTDHRLGYNKYYWFRLS